MLRDLGTGPLKPLAFKGVDATDTVTIDNHLVQIKACVKFVIDLGALDWTHAQLHDLGLFAPGGVFCHNHFVFSLRLHGAEHMTRVVLDAKLFVVRQ